MENIMTEKQAIKWVYDNLEKLACLHWDFKEDNYVFYDRHNGMIEHKSIGMGDCSISCYASQKFKNQHHNNSSFNCYGKSHIRFYSEYDRKWFEQLLDMVNSIRLKYITIYSNKIDVNVEQYKQDSELGLLCLSKYNIKQWLEKNMTKLSMLSWFIRGEENVDLSYSYGDINIRFF